MAQPIDYSIANAKDCPFCGGNDLHMTRAGRITEMATFYVHCIDCGTHGPVAVQEHRAFVQWNERKTLKVGAS